MGRKTLASMADGAIPATSIEQSVSRMTELGHTISRAVREADRSKYERTVEAQLRLVAGCPEGSENARLCLFTQMVLNMLSTFEAISEDSQGIDNVRTRYALAMPALQTASDMVEWFHANIVPVADALLLEPASKLDRIVRQACDLTARRLPEPIGRDDIAQALGLSSAYFGKVFREKTGLTFREFTKRLRVSKAQKLLLLPGKTVAEVAGEVGYSTTAALSRRFEQVCGASPCAYRNNPQAFPRVILPESIEA